MAFHVACPITCRRVCDCELGFPPGLRGGTGRDGFLAEVAALEEFLRDPWTVRPFLEDDEGAEGQREEETVQVLVPRVAPPSLQPIAAALAEEGGGGVGDEVKRAVMQRKALAASVAAEDYARMLESGGGVDALGVTVDNNARDDQGSTAKIICRICFSGENEDSKKAIKMLSCKTCSKKYHKSCLKSWAENRDLFRWSSWSCPSCRICEVCRRAGDPNKFMFCKRCDGAYHCYCQHPPHKNVGHGPYLCPKHTRCHSCGSTVPGSGLSTRWFLGYTCCDACGRLFVKGNYCPVCLKVYRDSEITPMVCCDVCEKWVHCMCDGISDEKYQQFQVDSNLQYKCAACRGDCYQVRDIDDAVRELWKRRNIADRELMSSLRAASGLPPQEQISSISPCSDDAQNGPVVLRNENNKALKFSVKGIGDKALKNSKDYGKNVSNKKLVKKKGYQIKIVGRTGEPYQNNEKEHETRSLESVFRDQKVGEINSNKIDGLEVFSSPISQSLNDNDVKSCINEVAGFDQSNVREAAGNNIDMVTKVRIKGGKTQVLQSKESLGKNDAMRGTKLVIHLGSKNRNISGSPHSEASSCHKDQDLAASFDVGSEDTIQQKAKDSKNIFPDNGRSIKTDDARVASSNKIKIPKHGARSIVNIRTVPEGFKKVNGSIADECEPNATGSSSPLPRKNDTNIATTVKAGINHRSEVNLNHSMDTSVKLNRDNLDAAAPKLSSASSNEHKPLLKLKFKNPYFEQGSSWASQGEDDNSVKGQRSKRKRPSIEKMAGREYASSSQLYQENLIDAAIDASWILKKLGKDAVGKRVEVQSSDSYWKGGVISDVNQSSSTLSVNLDDGRFQALELGKQAIRLISQKQKRSRT